MNKPFNEFKSVEATKAASVAVQKLFPAFLTPGIQGELQTIVRLSWERKGNDEAITKAGLWWLWFRNIFIENTMLRDSKRKVMIFACEASTTGQPITFVTTRSPELLHAQIGMANSSLPRSRKSLQRFRDLVEISSKKLPTTAKVLLADLAIDNAHQIGQVCNIEQMIDDNLAAIEEIVREIGLECSVQKLSSVVSLEQPLPIPPHAWSLIKRVMAESLNSHITRFGWTREQSEQHNLNLAVTMGMVGLAIHSMNRHILIHNESFISRGALNNIFNPPHDPLPVICLIDLLESKASKE